MPAGGPATFSHQCRERLFAIRLVVVVAIGQALKAERKLLLVVRAAAVVQAQRDGMVARFFIGNEIVDSVSDLAGRAHVRVVDVIDGAQLGGFRELVTEIGDAGIVAVVGIGPLADGVEFGSVQRIIETRWQPAGEIGDPAVSLEAAALVGSGAVRNGVLGIAVLGEELDDAGGGLRAEERAFGTAHHFHAIEAFGGEILQVELAAWIVERDAVEQDQTCRCNRRRAYRPQARAPVGP